jgi:N-acetylglutamate synthase-like GNAT family acetyltransferase
MLTIRRTTADDIPTIQRFTEQLQQHLNNSNPETWRRDPTTPQYMKSVKRETTDPENYTLIAELDGEPVGYISTRIQDRMEPSPRKIGEIMNTYVQPAHRRKGITTTLLKHILKNFNENQVEEITLRYIIGNKEAENYWTSLGFKPAIITANITPKKLAEKLEK